MLFKRFTSIALYIVKCFGSFLFSGISENSIPDPNQLISAFLETTIICLHSILENLKNSLAFIP